MTTFHKAAKTKDIKGNTKLEGLGLVEEEGFCRFQFNNIFEISRKFKLDCFKAMGKFTEQ